MHGHGQYLHIQSDVYSFGVVVLEIACGRPATIADVNGTTIHLVHWVWEFYSRGRILDAADARLNGDFNAAEMERVMVTALWCAHPDRTRRPHPGGYECAPPPGRTVAKSPCERASGSVVVLAVASLPASDRSPAIATLVTHLGVCCAAPKYEQYLSRVMLQWDRDVPVAYGISGFR